MECAASYFNNSYVQQEKRAAGGHRGVRDTNVFSLKFNDLPNYKTLLTVGDPFACKSCKAFINSESSVLTSADYNAKFPEESKDAARVPVEAGSFAWLCEFCSTHNVVPFPKEALPKTKDAFYLLKSEAQVQEEKKAVSDEKAADPNSDISVIFCLDVSGSMDTIVGNGLSRLDLVRGAISQQVKDMVKENPNRKVGFVFFGEGVTILGDGFEKAQKVPNMNDFDACKKSSQIAAGTMLVKPIVESQENLLNKIKLVNTEGSTALGPGLLAGLGLAMQGSPGSQVVLCTDGLANVGLGDIGTSQKEADAKLFYEKVGNLAKDCGVSISIITMKGSGAKVEILGRACEISGGLITKVDPANVGKDFGLMMKDEIVGTSVELEVHLHKGLKFRDEDSSLFENGSVLKKSIGNVTALTELTYEYEMKNKTELEKDKIDIEKLDQIPFQAHIYFTTRNGDRCVRVITMQQKTTKDEEKVEESAKVEMIAKRGLQRTAALAQAGKIEEARFHAKETNAYYAGVQKKQQFAMPMAAPRASEEMMVNMQMNQMAQIEQLHDAKSSSKKVSQEEQDSVWGGIFQAVKGKWI